MATQTPKTISALKTPTDKTTDQKAPGEGTLAEKPLPKRNLANRILVRSPNWIGDQVLAYPFFHYLRQFYPRAEITVVCVPWVESIQFRNLIDEVKVLPKADGPGLLDRWKNFEATAETLRNPGGWDLSICLPNSFSSAWLFYRARAKAIRGYRTDARGLLMNEGVPWDSRQIHHRAEDYLRLLLPEAGKIGKGADVPHATEFWSRPRDLRRGTGRDTGLEVDGVLEEFDAAKAWPEAEPIPPPSEPYWVLAPGSTAESRRWPLRSFSQLAQQIKDATGWTGIVVGGAAEASLAAKLMENTNLKLLDWTGRGSVASLWKVLRSAQFSVCNDSGIAHVASLCGCPVYVTWGAGDPRKTQPLGPGKVELMLNPIDCWPCERNQCSQMGEKKLGCLKATHPDAVWKEIESELRAKT